MTSVSGSGGSSSTSSRSSSTSTADRSTSSSKSTSTSTSSSERSQSARSTDGARPSATTPEVQDVVARGVSDEKRARELAGATAETRAPTDPRLAQAASSLPAGQVRRGLSNSPAVAAVSTKAAPGDAPAVDAAAVDAAGGPAEAAAPTDVERAQADAARVEEAAARSPVEGAQTFEQLMRENPSQEYRDALVDASQETLEQIGRDVAGATQNPDVDDPQGVARDSYGALASAQELAGPEAGERVSAAFTSGLADVAGAPTDIPIAELSRSVAVSQGFREAIEGGAPAGLAVDTAVGLHEQGVTGLAEHVGAQTSRAVDTLRSDFERADEAASARDAELGRLQAGFDGLVSAEGMERATEAFQADPENAAVYAERDAAAERLSSALDSLGRAATLEGGNDGISALRDSAREALSQAPALARSEAGRAALADGLERAGQGDTSLVDGLRAAAGDDVEKQAAIGDALNRAGGERYLTALDAGSPAASDVMRGLGAASDLTGASAAAANDLARATDAFLASDRSGAATDAFLGVVRDATGALSDGATALGRPTTANGFRALGTFATGVAAARGFMDFSEAGREEQLRTVVAAASAGSDVGATVLGQLGHTRAAGLFSAVGRVAGGFSVAFDALDAARSFQDGDTVQGLASVSKAAGGIAALAGATGVGAVLVGAGIGVSLIDSAIRAGQERSRQDGDAREFLENAGVPPETASILGQTWGDGENPGAFLQQVAPRMGMTGPELMRHLETLPPDQRDFFVRAAAILPRDENGMYPAEDRAGQIGPNGRVLGPPQSIDAFLAVLANYDDL